MTTELIRDPEDGAISVVVNHVEVRKSSSRWIKLRWHIQQFTRKD